MVSRLWEKFKGLHYPSKVDLVCSKQMRVSEVMEIPQDHGFEYIDQINGLNLDEKITEDWWFPEITPKSIFMRFSTKNIDQPFWVPP